MKILSSEHKILTKNPYVKQVYDLSIYRDQVIIM